MCRPTAGPYRRTLKFLASGLGVVFVAAACTSTSHATSTVTPAAPSVTLAQEAPSPVEQGPSGRDEPNGAGLPKPLVDPAEIRSGGPPPDGIPAIDHPRFQRADQISWLKPNEPVLAATVNGEDRAYPVQILVWHEIVNDTLAGIPVAVTYCPLCNTAIAYDRRAAGRVLDFGTSGKLYNSDLVAYDRQTRSLWVQILGQAVAGVLTGTQLHAYPVATVAWADWRRAHPQSWVLSRDTGHPRDYGHNPYPGYDDIHSSPFLFTGKADGRHAAMTRIVGLERDTDTVGVVLDGLRRRGAIEITLAGQPVVVWDKPGTTSPFGAKTVGASPDVGATGAFDPVLDGRHLTFDPTPDGFQDQQTNTTWDVLGRGIVGRLAGRTLTPVAHVDTFWFAWAAFRPASRIIAG